MQGIFWLSLGSLVNIILFICQKAGITNRPGWIRKLIGSNNHEKKMRAQPSPPTQLDFRFLTSEGSVRLASDMTVDVEAEMRRQQALGSSTVRNINFKEHELDEKLYDWWKVGGWWGEADSSGEYTEPERDDDVTSVISMSTATEVPSESWTDDESSGQRTPTRDNPFPSRRFGANDLVDEEGLATLLDPQTVEQQQEARMLSRRLRSSGVMTRSQYQHRLDRDRATILTTARAFNPERKHLASDEEERRLEQFILEQRAKVEEKYQPRPPTSSDGESSWNAGAPGMGSAGPMCVVCQDAPRTILLWPCGCLSMCDDCRVSMATRNFTNCVCCRTGTEAFSRLYVP